MLRQVLKPSLAIAYSAMLAACSFPEATSSPQSTSGGVDGSADRALSLGNRTAQADSLQPKMLATSSWGFPDDLPTACARAHEEYLSQHFLEFGEALTQCLSESPDDTALQNNMLALLRRAYELNKGVLPSRAKKPTGLESLNLKNQVAATLGAARETVYKIEIRFRPEPGNEVTNLQLVDVHNKSIVELGDAQTVVYQDTDGFVQIRRNYKVPQPDGLYKVRIALNNTEPQEFAVPVVDWTSTSFPSLTEPANMQVFANTTPRFSWAELYPQRPGIAKNFPYVAAYRSEAPEYQWQKAWESRGLGWEAREVRVGDQINGRGVGALQPGRYVAWLSTQEMRDFGFIHVTRSAADKRTFFVSAEQIR